MFDNVYKDLDLQIQSQYRNSNVGELIRAILEIKQTYIYNAYISLIKDNLSLDTAKGDGLDLWGLILGFHRNVIADYISQLHYTLSDDNFRLILQCLYQKNFIHSNILNVNDFVNDVFSHFGEVGITDSTDMSYQFFIFNQKLPSWLKFCLENKDLVPRPAGIGVAIQENIYFFFGFEPNDSDKDTNAEAYKERVEWFNANIGNFDNSIYYLDTQARQEALNWFNSHIGNFDISLFENYENGDYILGFDYEAQE